MKSLSIQNTGFLAPKVASVSYIGHDTGGADAIFAISGGWNRAYGVTAATTSSLIYNKGVVSISFYLKKIGSPTGTISFQMINASNALVQTYGTVAASSLTTSYVKTTVTGTRQVLGEDFSMIVIFDGGDASNYVSMERQTTGSYDTTNTIMNIKDASNTWSQDDSRDARFEIGYT